MPEPDLLAVARGTITAPAGCGKTQLIAASLLRHSSPKPILILTHTNAGVAALRSRLNRCGANSRRYNLTTIDGWAMRLVRTYPRLSRINLSALNLNNPARDYPLIRTGAINVLTAHSLKAILPATYARILVDEYQDCSTIQHDLVLRASAAVPTCVLGDPLQAIFGFGGNALVDWEGTVLRVYPAAGELSTPWRWINAQQQDLGEWLLEVRRRLLTGLTVDLRQAPQTVTWIELDGPNDGARRLIASQTESPIPGGKVLIIAASMDKGDQHSFASRTPGAIAVEAVDLKDLTAFASAFCLQDERALARLCHFASIVSTGDGLKPTVDAVRLVHIGATTAPTSRVDSAALAFKAGRSYANASSLLRAITEAQGVRTYRPAVLSAGLRSLDKCQLRPDHTLLESAIVVREEYRAAGRSLPTRAVGSTLLLKGLEAAVSVILYADTLKAPDLYVAMTRGSHALVICSATPVLPK